MLTADSCNGLRIADTMLHDNTQVTDMEQVAYENDSWMIRPAKPEEDPEGVVKSFKETYGESYPFKSFLREDGVRELIEDDDTHTYVVELKAGTEVDGETLDEDTVIGTGSVVYEEDGRKAELGKAAIRPDYRGLEHDGDRPFQDLVETRLEDVAENGADVVYTNSVSTHGKTQHMFEKHDFEPVAYERQKYPDVFDSGREGMIVMVRRPEETDEKQVYLPDVPGARKAAEHSLAALDLVDDRELAGVDPGLEDTVGLGAYRDEEVSNHALYELQPGDDLHVADAEREIASTLADDLDYVEVTMSVEDPAAARAGYHLAETGFVPSGYVPEWIEDGDGAEDALIWQYSPGDHNTIQATERTREMLDELGLTGEYGSQVRPADVDGVYDVDI